jgi:dienelactone hydrolase
MSAEGLLLQPSGPIRERIVAVPDAGMQPEQFTTMQHHAAKGAQVLIPLLIDRESKWSGNPDIGKTTKQSHREFLYRMSFPLGRHLAGYEVQKVLAAVDWFGAQSPRTAVSVYGIGDGAAIAAYAKALDPRIAKAYGNGFPWDRGNVAQEPIDRNIWKIRQASNVQPLASFPEEAKPLLEIPVADAEARMHRQFDEIQEFNQKLIPKSEHVRENLWSATPKDTIRDSLWNDVLGRIPKQTSLPLNIRRKKSYETPKWTGYEVQFDVLPHVFAYGVLLVPNDIPAGEKRPVIVVQHGLHGRPQHMFLQTGTREADVYRNLAATLAERGHIVYVPQNPYTGMNAEFRTIVRHGNPLGLSLYSFILAQYEKMLDVLALEPAADMSRLGFYGLSYGGKTALRIPALMPQFRAVVCSGDFNEWIYKLTTVNAAYSYMFTPEYEILEYGLANVANHAEMAMLIAPRAFLVERGHRDTVGADEWVAYEFAKVKRYYDENGWGSRTGLALFNGPHRIDGEESIPFLERWLAQKTLD